MENYEIFAQAIAQATAQTTSQMTEQSIDQSMFTSTVWTIDQWIIYLKKISVAINW